MQTQLPFFPSNTKLINSTVGFREVDGTVFYFHNGNPIYCHGKDDRNGYRFSMASLNVNGSCKVHELCTALGIVAFFLAASKLGEGRIFEGKSGKPDKSGNFFPAFPFYGNISL